jgi:ABC-type nickel/cobalt efflux system permease component RcnA
MGAGFKSADEVSALPALLASAVLFGVVHAFMPGTAKACSSPITSAAPAGFVTGF